MLALAVFLGLATNTVFGWLQARRKVALAYAVPALVGVMNRTHHARYHFGTGGRIAFESPHRFDQAASFREFH